MRIIDKVFLGSTLQGNVNLLSKMAVSIEALSCSIKRIYIVPHPINTWYCLAFEDTHQS